MGRTSGDGYGRGLAPYLLLALLIMALGATLSYSWSAEANYRNVTIDTRVNITNSRPEVLRVIIDNGVDNVTLNAGAIRIVTCNVSVRDWNGGASITNVTAVFFDNTSVGHAAANDNNDHYENDSCTQTEVDGYYANFTCTFDVYYYANASVQWICNATVTDEYDFNGSDYDFGYNYTEIESLYALNVTTMIDYGNMAVGDTSPVRQANITNYGNRPINISLYGYGAVPGDGLAMNCTIGNITIDNEKYSLVSSADFTTEYISLSPSQQTLGNLTVNREIIDGTQVVNTTYWRLYVPPNPFGTCNGTIVFQAEIA